MRFDTDKGGYILTTEQLDDLFREREELKKQVENGKSAIDTNKRLSEKIVELLDEIKELKSLIDSQKNQNYIRESNRYRNNKNLEKGMDVWCVCLYTDSIQRGIVQETHYKDNALEYFIVFFKSGGVFTFPGIAWCNEVFETCKEAEERLVNNKE